MCGYYKPHVIVVYVCVCVTPALVVVVVAVITCELKKSISKERQANVIKKISKKYATLKITDIFVVYLNKQFTAILINIIYTNHFDNTKYF